MSTWANENKSLVLGTAALAGVALFFYLKSKKPTHAAGPDHPAWAILMEKTFERAERVQNQVNDTMRQLMERDEEEGIDDTIRSSFDTIAEQETENFIKNNKVIFDDLFTSYDINADGDLSLNECEALTRDSMIVVQASLPKFVRRLAELSYDGQRKLIAALGNDEEEDDGDRRAAHVDAEVAKCIPIGNQIIAELLADTDAIAKSCWSSMDYDNDNRVSRDEFCKFFFSLNQNNVGINKVWSLVQEERSKHP